MDPGTPPSLTGEHTGMWKPSPEKSGARGRTRSVLSGNTRSRNHRPQPGTGVNSVSGGKGAKDREVVEWN